MAAGGSNVQPVGGTNFMGAEVNGQVTWMIRPMLELALHGAYLQLGDYYRSPEIVVGSDGSGRPQNPWTVFATLKWLMF